MLAILKLLQSLADAQPVIAQVHTRRTEADRRAADAKPQLDAQKQRLDTELKSLTGGCIRLPRLPGT